MHKKAEIYLEYRTIGKQTKVTAIDSATGHEVSCFGPIGTDRKYLEQIVVKKLQRALSMLKAGDNN